MSRRYQAQYSTNVPRNAGTVDLLTVLDRTIQRLVLSLELAHTPGFDPVALLAAAGWTTATPMDEWTTSPIGMEKYTDDVRPAA